VVNILCVDSLTGFRTTVCEIFPPDRNRVDELIVRVNSYHEAPGLTVKETWTGIAEELGPVSALDTLEGHRDRSLKVDDIELTHRGIFEPIFGEQTLSFRSGHRKERVDFPIVVGSPGQSRMQQAHGTGGKNIERKLRKALEAFNRDTDALASRPANDKPTVGEAASAAVRLYDSWPEL
jgi:hypothetical protein